jgi:hypothetical protein
MSWLYWESFPELRKPGKSTNCSEDLAISQRMLCCYLVLGPSWMEVLLTEATGYKLNTVQLRCSELCTINQLIITYTFRHKILMSANFISLYLRLHGIASFDQKILSKFLWQMAYMKTLLIRNSVHKQRPFPVSVSCSLVISRVTLTVNF